MWLCRARVSASCCNTAKPHLVLRSPGYLRSVLIPNAAVCLVCGFCAAPADSSDQGLPLPHQMLSVLAVTGCRTLTLLERLSVAPAGS